VSAKTSTKLLEYASAIRHCVTCDGITVMLLLLLLLLLMMMMMMMTMICLIGDIFSSGLITALCSVV